jgi:hypothetical protein
MASPGYPHAVEGVCRWRRQQRYWRRLTRLRRSLPGILATSRLAKPRTRMSADHRDVSRMGQGTVGVLRSISCSLRCTSRRGSWAFSLTRATRRCPSGAPTDGRAGAKSPSRRGGPRLADPHVGDPLAAATSSLTRGGRPARLPLLAGRATRSPARPWRSAGWSRPMALAPARGPPPASRLAGAANRRSQCVRMSSSMPPV